MNWAFVDDADPRIQYSSGWQAFVNGSEFDGTKHGAAEAGLTATLNFTGSQVVVVGSLGSVDVHGVPTTLYTIDSAEAGLYTAPIIQPGGFALNVTFFQSKVLPPGDHTLTITNVNGTKPNVFWLDYIEYLPSTAASASFVGAGSTSFVATSLSHSTVSPATTAIDTTSTTETSTVSSSTVPASRRSRSDVGPIAGGVVSSVVLVLSVILLVCYLRRRQRSTSDAHGIRPFGSWRSARNKDHVTRPRSPSKQMVIGGLSVPLPASAPSLKAVGSAIPTSVDLPPSLLSPASSSAPVHAVPLPVPTNQRQSGELVTSSSSSGGLILNGEIEPSVLVQSVDSGLRLTRGTSILPPPYTAD
ncbi:hypothetical protein BD311DRAFT_781595 [Dichomitus squalens]|uniref:Transmembrane protein n=1 Tax=Dichomitus squalens TaxID=114155 RepID=A0A4Q9MAU6_9APHY|nr:hypothetical protein BD311DRAFT_781595 [Dichomitus squalens]